jgi:hypothetical protein
MARHCWVDASAGVAGDMLLGALIDAGASLDACQAAIDAVMPATVHLDVSGVRRAGMRATKVDVVALVADLPHRSWNDIRAMIQGSPLPEDVRTRAVTVFAGLAEAEARAHGVPVAEVHFHEVGAWDSIADIVGVCAALADLGVSRLSAGPIALGSGHVQTSHGQIPIPVPAVLELSAGWRVLSGGPGELTTPTGMALVSTLGQACEDLPALSVTSVGIGAGTRDPQGRANVVRVVVGSPEPEHRSGVSAEAGVAVLIEANIDDLDPRVWPSVLDDLLVSGASDAWLIPILMKKGRPAHTLCVLVDPTRVDALRARIFALVPTLGVREHTVSKWALDRTWRPVEVLGDTVRIKIGHSGGLITSATPEYEDVAEVARRVGAPVRDVLAAAIAAAGTAGLAPGHAFTA